MSDTKVAEFQKELQALIEKHKIGIVPVPKYVMAPEGYFVTTAENQLVDLEKVEEAKKTASESVVKEA